MLDSTSPLLQGERTLIRVLDQFSIVHNDQPVCEGLVRRKHARLLLTLLASEDSLSRQRDNLTQTLWPQLELAKANNRLHQTLHWLRKELEELPEPDRPVIRLSENVVELRITPSTAIDVQLLRARINGNTDDPHLRLNELAEALTVFGKGEIAEGLDNWEIEILRSQLLRERIQVLQEAVSLAQEMNDTRAAIEYSTLLYEIPNAPNEIRLDHARLLNTYGRSNAAIAACESLRVECAEDPDALGATNELAETIRRAINVPQSQNVLEALDTGNRAPTMSCHHGLHGYQPAQESCHQTLRDPRSNIVTIVGPDGCGKSLFALNAAVRIQHEFTHGALMIESDGTPEEQEFESQVLSSLQNALKPPTEGQQTESTDTQSELTDQLRSLNILLVIDGRPISAAMATTIKRLAAVNRDVRWLVTSNRPLRCNAERIIELDPSSLLESVQPGGDRSDAVRIIEQAARVSLPADSAAIERLQQAAEIVDSLPASLIDLGHCLRSNTASELLHLLNTNPVSVVGRDPDSAPGANDALQAFCVILAQAAPECRHLIVTLSQFRTWLTRTDLMALSGIDDPTRFNAILQKGHFQHWLKRRVEIRNDEEVSLFRLSFISSLAAVELNKTAENDSRASVEHWLIGLHEVMPPIRQIPLTTEKLRWFEQNLTSIDTVISRWITDGNLSQIARVCLTYGSRWSELTCAARILSWLQQIDSVPRSSDSSHLALILFHRAGLRVALADEAQGVSDALRAIGIASKHDYHYICDDATRLIQQVETTRRRPSSRSARLVNRRGLQAGASLMRSAQLALRVNEYARAGVFVKEAIKLFEYFDMSYCALNAFIYQSQIGYSTGNLDLLIDSENATQCLADKSGVTVFRYWAMALRAKRELAGSLFAQSATTCLEVCAFADSNYRGRAELGIDAMITAAWAHYGLGAYRVARSLCEDVLSCSHHRVSAEQRVELLMLLALSQARLDNRPAALHAVLEVRTRIECHSIDLDRQTLGTAAAELASLLDRADLSAMIADELERHVNAVNCTLRPWTLARLEAIKGLNFSPRLEPDSEETVSKQAVSCADSMSTPDQLKLEVERFLSSLSRMSANQATGYRETLARLEESSGFAQVNPGISR